MCEGWVGEEEGPRMVSPIVSTTKYCWGNAYYSTLVEGECCKRYLIVLITPITSIEYIMSTGS